MLRWLFVPAVLLVLLGCRDESPAEGAAALAAPAEGGGAVHIVRLIARADRFAFEPDEVHIRAGETVRFVHTEHIAETVAFDPAGVPAGGAEFLQAQDALIGPLLTYPGAVHDVHFRGAPEGEYHFHSVAHAEEGMRGRVIVQP